MVAMTMPHISYLIISDIGMPTDQGYDFINNYTIIQCFYTVLNAMVPAPCLPQPCPLMPPLAKQEFAREHSKEALDQLLLICSRVRVGGAQATTRKGRFRRIKCSVLIICI
ncbi:hypothetical protein BDR07DRAFT_224710 [Suillus spraguei]|nr:hypothetical protein BDR07DRAFT_644638 [Suillus spraguei]KAG2367652.1 hypothetical protein BDR07DRAFT_224710 [Suillus spraguei]